MSDIRTPKIDKIAFIDSCYAKIFGKPVLVSLMIISAFAFFATMWNRYVYIDDAFFGEQSYWLAKDGVVKVPSLIDFLGCDIQLFSYHKLNIVVGAVLIKLFGWGITPLRTITLLFFCGLLYFVFKYYKSEKATFTNKHMLVAFFMLGFTPQIFLLAYTFRPEVWVTFFGFVSYFYLNKLIKENNTKLAIVSGIFAGLAFLTHLNGLIFPVAGFVVLIFQKKYKSLLLFSIASILICSLYLWDLLQDHNFATWLYQLKNWPNNNSPNYFKGDIFSFFYSVLVKLSEEHQRFFWGYKVWAISGFFVLSFAFSFKYLYNQHRVLFIYIITLILTQNIAGSQIAERYLIYYYPFFAIIIAIDIVKIWSEKKYIRKTIYMILLVLQIGCVVNVFGYIIKENKYTIPYYDATLARIPDKKALILVPYEMFFNGLGNYNLASYKGFEYYQVKLKRNLTREEFFKRASSFGIKYIVIPERVLDKVDESIPCLNSNIIEENIYYNEFYSDDKTIILALRTLN
jgi:hypothetical protein